MGTLLRGLIGTGILLGLGACRLFAPCPTCPPQLPAQAVQVEVPCELPGKLSLPAAPRTECPAGSPSTLVCFEIQAAGNIALREAAMKDWIREARARCGASPPEVGSGSGG